MTNEAQEREAAVERAMKRVHPLAHLEHIGAADAHLRPAYAELRAAITAELEAAEQRGRVDALTCVCGHLWQLHDGHTYSPPDMPHSFCSQADGCKIFTPPAKALAEWMEPKQERRASDG